jgi:hypothetical protein
VTHEALDNEAQDLGHPAQYVLHRVVAHLGVPQSRVIRGEGANADSLCSLLHDEHWPQEVCNFFDEAAFATTQVEHNAAKASQRANLTKPEPVDR